MIEKYIQKTPTEVEAISFNGNNAEEIEKAFITPISKQNGKYFLDDGVLTPLHLFDFVVKDGNSIHIYSPYEMDLLYKKK